MKSSYCERQKVLDQIADYVAVMQQDNGWSSEFPIGWDGHSITIGNGESSDDVDKITDVQLCWALQPKLQV
jgi:hypothetical protein